MNPISISSEIIKVLTFLFPGLVTGIIFHSLTSHKKPSIFDRLVSSLIFTFLVKFIVLIFSISDLIKPLTLASDPNSSELLLSPVELLVAVIFGIFTSLIFNQDILHKFLRFVRITKETSYPSEWHSMFVNHGDKAAISLYLKDGSYLQGQLAEWPRDPKNGYFRIKKVCGKICQKEDVIMEDMKEDKAKFLIPVTQVKILYLDPMIESQKKSFRLLRRYFRRIFQFKFCRKLSRCSLAHNYLAGSRQRTGEPRVSPGRQPSARVPRRYG